MCVLMILDPCAHLKCEYHSVCRAIDSTHAKCECPTMCPKTYAPVCGDDGQTYTNLCGLKITSCNKRKKINAVKEGPCG